MRLIEYHFAVHKEGMSAPAHPAESLLKNIWYFALPAAQLRRGQMVAKLLLNEPMVFCRDADGRAFALRDICPHRGIPLSCGKFDGREIECCYHGWRFNDQGTCTAIPSLGGHENIIPDKIKVRHYPVHEAAGNLWIYMYDGREAPKDLPPPPEIPDFTTAPQLTEILHFPCAVDHAVIGLMDPAHGPFVHQSWWWRQRRSIHEKAKPFGPTPLGWTMRRHRPSSNSLAYKILGGVPETEIRFILPGIRIEHIIAGAKRVVNLTTVTPIDATTTEVTHSIYWNWPVLTALRPLIRRFARRFLGQDRDVVVKQQRGLKYENNLLLIRDADTQARWYQQWKAEYLRAQNEQRAPHNPVPETVLRWRS
jgi:phenylpropionate dioxygenase-like ring-hydroxylating dioxygenase large terminal subunit